MENDTGARRMRCGCGFELVGADATIEVFNEHICTDAEVPPLMLIGAIAMLAGVR